MVSGFLTFPLPAFLHCAYGIWSGETGSQFCVQDDELNCRYGPNYWHIGLGVIFFSRDVLCIFVPSGVQKINHWSHKKGLPHVTWHRSLHPLAARGWNSKEQCTQLPFLITANSSLMSHNECIWMYLWFVLHYMACCIGVSVVSSRQEDHIFKGLSLPPFLAQKSRILNGYFLNCRRTKVSIRCGIHSGWVSFGNLGFHSRLKFGVIGHLVKYWIRWMLWYVEMGCFPHTDYH